MEMTIQLHETTNGRKYFYIYEVYIKAKDGKCHAEFRYMDEEKAEETAKIWNGMEDIEVAFVIHELVFI